MKIKEFLPGLSIAILISLLAWFLGNLFPIIGGPVLGLFIRTSARNYFKRFSET